MAPPSDSLELTPEGSATPSTTEMRTLGRFGRYDLVRRLAAGGMAEIFVARGPGPDGHDVDLVVKRILPHLADNPRFVEMFSNEASIASHLHHKNIVQVFDFGEVEGQWYLAMEYVHGLDTWRLLRRLSRTQEHIPASLSIWITREMLAGLEWVHNAVDPLGVPLHIVHRDVSPSNVYVSQDGDVKLGDFGIARARLSGAVADMGTLKGKYGYMAPEQILGRPFDHRADLFAASVVLSEMLLGHALFAGNSKLSVLLAVRDVNIDSLRKRAPELPPGLFDVLLRALSRDPDSRYASARELSDALGGVLTANGMAPNAEALADIVRLAMYGTKRRAAFTEPTTAVSHPPPPQHTRRDHEVTPMVDAVPAKVALAESPPSETFMVREGGSRRGPLRYAELVELLTTGKVGPGASVSRNGGPERPITREADLARHLPMRSTLPPPSGRTGPSDRVVGQLSEESPVSVFCRLATARETGLLVLESGPVVKEVYLVEGRPEHVMSNLAGEMLGEFLVNRKVITRGELDMALAILPRFDGKLGDTLSSLGLLEPLELLRHITEQVKTKLLDAFRWRRGRFSFTRGLRPPPGAFPLGIDPFQLIVEGVAHGYTNHEIALLRPSWEGRRFVATPSYGPGLFALPLPPHWARVLDIAGQGGTLREILEKGGVEAPETMRALFLGLESGILAFQK